MQVELTEVSVVTVVETLWARLLLLSVSVAADSRTGRTDCTEAVELKDVPVVMVVGTLWALLLLLSVSVEAEWLTGRTACTEDGRTLRRRWNGRTCRW